MNSKKFYTISLLFILCFNVFYVSEIVAAKANPNPIEVKQGNGNDLTIRLYGDEFFSYATTLDNYLIKQDNNGNFYYQILDSNNKLILSSVLANNEEKRTTSEKQFLQTINQSKLFQTLDTQTKVTDKLRSARQEIVSPKSSALSWSGENRFLVILVEFQDVAFTTPNPQQAFNNMLNEQGYSYNGATGSARDYFIENSSGKFNPAFDVFGPVKLPNNLAFYGEPEGTSNDKNPRQMVYDACSILKETLGDQIDFSKYDVDKSGLVDNVYIYFAGRGQNDGGIPNTIWAHSWNILDLDLTIDGVKVAKYACSGETKNKPGNPITGIGTFTHEFLHVLGLPDLYATNKNPYAFTPKEWSVMDSGNYNNEQNTPPYMSVFERESLGWLETIEINSAANVLVPIIKDNKAYRISTSNLNEYYLLENRQNTGWDKFVPGHGMLVWHIDYDAEVWGRNAINNDENHQRVDIVEADASKTTSSRNGDVFPGILGINSFTDDTNPSMKTWSDQALNKPITEIVESDGIVYFKFMGGKNLEGKVIVLTATDITQTGFNANWKAFEGAIKYTLDLYVVKEDESLTPVYSYEEKNVGNVTSFKLENLEPGFKYKYAITAYDAYSSTVASDYVQVQTLAPTFEYYIPLAQKAKNVTENSFDASWETLSDATAYFIDVYKKNYSVPEGQVQIDFTNRVAGIPSDWKTNCTSVYSTEGFFGEKTPSLRIDTDKQYLESPIFQHPIFNLSFWYRGVNANAANSISIMGYDGNKWREISKIMPLLNDEDGQKVSVDFDGVIDYYAVSILLNKPATGAVAFDDVKLTYGVTTSIEKVTGYDALNVGNVLSNKVIGLDKNETYYYTVKGVSGDVLSRASKEIKLITIPTSGINTIKYTSELFFDGDVICIRSNTSKDSQLHIYDVTGKLVFTTEFVSEIRIPKMQIDKGVYLLKVGTDIYKVINK